MRSRSVVVVPIMDITELGEEKRIMEGVGVGVGGIVTVIEATQ